MSIYQYTHSLSHWVLLYNSDMSHVYIYAFSSGRARWRHSHHAYRVWLVVRRPLSVVYQRLGGVQNFNVCVHLNTPWILVKRDGDNLLAPDSCLSPIYPYIVMKWDVKRQSINQSIVYFMVYQIKVDQIILLVIHTFDHGNCHPDNYEQKDAHASSYERRNMHLWTFLRRIVNVYFKFSAYAQ